MDEWGGVRGDLMRQVVILEDSAARVAALRQALGSALPGCEAVVFAAVGDFIDWMVQHAGETALVCLDHDLRHGAPTGLDAAEFLANQAPVCPVVVHSSNTAAVGPMLRALSAAGWVCSAVTTGEDGRNVADEWTQEVEWLRGQGLLDP